MKRIAMLSLAAAAMIAVSAGVSISQQDARQPDQQFSQINARLERLEQAQKQALQKLETVIANQQKIMDELNVVKIRATRK
mgnify:CR=1 FL=1